MISKNDKLALGSLCTRDESGKHFTSLHSSEWLERMEAAGLISIDRPVHRKTGIPYDQSEWTVEVSPEVSDWFDSYGEFVE